MKSANPYLGKIRHGLFPKALTSILTVSALQACNVKVSPAFKLQAPSLLISKKTGFLIYGRMDEEPCRANRNWAHPGSSRKDITITKPRREEIVHPYSLIAQPLK
ncbi:hypothetical protein Zmor_010179 [Zophobas morio]|uniref:Uncharacterized protein n=1 Tax=Zophobas morio TaxID=2755281 RepID=A0AA38INV3_9CUCU|nr:hypothetical protein Zmor_010179 [Zophobas morio]